MERGLFRFWTDRRLSYSTQNSFYIAVHYPEFSHEKANSRDLQFSGSAHKTRLVWISLPPAPAYSGTHNTARYLSVTNSQLRLQNYHHKTQVHIS
jgi:hypothetical protein